MSFEEVKHYKVFSAEGEQFSLYRHKDFDRWFLWNIGANDISPRLKEIDMGLAQILKLYEKIDECE